MPQLMPLSWVMSSFVIIFLLLMMVLIYFDLKIEGNNIIMEKSEKFILNWEW